MAAGRVPKPLPDPKNIFVVAEHFLRREHLADCRNYAQQVFEIDPDFPGVTEILAVADVLIASKNQLSTEIPHDWYAVMQLDRFSQDDLINRRFNYLYPRLHPGNNRFPFADKAFHVLCDAWYVLSNPEKRREFDDSLKRLLNDENPKDTSVIPFWTVCPYCYYVYEFPRVYLELFLMCPNEKCSKAFTCVEIDQPPVEILTQGNYICAGFSPLGFRYCNWNPFAPLKKQEAKTSPVTGNFVQISDDDEAEGTKKKDVKDEGVDSAAGSVNPEVHNHNPTMKPPVRRMKMMAKRTKKVTGVGNRVTKEGIIHQQETNPSNDDDDDDCEHNVNLGNVGDDDILVSL